MIFTWEDGFSIQVQTENGQILISANRAGLRSLAENLSRLAEEVPGSHVHLDEGNSLEEGSSELIVELVEK